MNRTNVIEGPMIAARNWSADAGAGSIHDDATAAELGFRGGTVAGDVHMNQFPPVLIEAFGPEWFERGNLSLRFRNATVDLERVRAYANRPVPGMRQIEVWMRREDGLEVCRGTAALDDHGASALATLDLRPCDPSELRILNRLKPGMSLGSYDVVATPERQFQRYDAGLISDPLSWYRERSPWGGVVAAPCTVVEYLWGCPMQALGPLVGESVGLFGAIEIGFVNGPMLLDRRYLIDSEVVCVGHSPQTEYVWYDTVARNSQGAVVARLRMQSRAMKASSPAYRDD